MNAWTNLVSLISSLEKPERKAFKLLAGQQRQDKKYLLMFEELERLIAADAIEIASPDEGHIKMRLARIGIGENQAQVKTYLTRMIFKSLRILEDARTKEDELKNMMQEAILLERKGLFAFADQKLSDVLEQVGLYEFYQIEIEALQHLIYVRSQQNIRNYADHMSTLCVRIEMAAARLKTENEYRSLHFQVFALSRSLKKVQHEQVGERLAQFAANPLLSDMAEPVSFLSKLWQKSILSNIANIRSDKQKACFYAGQCAGLWQEYPHFQVEYPRNYLISLANHLNFCLAIKSFDGIETLLDSMKAIETRSYDEKAEAFQNIAFLEQLYYLNTGQIQRAANMVPHIEKGLGEYRTKLNRAREITLRVNSMVAFFALGDYETALDKLTEILNLGKSEHRQDLQSMAKLLQTILHLELRHDKYIDQLVKNTAQNLRDNEQFFDFERLVLGNLNRLAQLRKKHLPEKAEAAATQPLLLRFREELSQFAEKTREKHTPGLEEIGIWVEAKISGKTFGEVLLAKTTHR